jgi:membrane protein required for colicin V production
LSAGAAFQYDRGRGQPGVSDMNYFDIALLILASVLILIGVMKGLVRLLIGLAALIAAFAVAARFHQPLAASMDSVEIHDGALMLLSYFLLFIGVMLLGGLTAYLLRKLMKAAMLGWADRLGGAAVGPALATLLAVLIILPMVAYSPGSSEMLSESVLAPFISEAADVASPMVPQHLSDLYNEKIEALRQLWQEKFFDSENPRT